MRGASRASLSVAKERLAAALVSGSAATADQVGDELFVVVGLLDDEPGLRRALSDSSRSAGARQALAEGLLAGKISELALAQVTGLAGERWSDSGDLADALEQIAAVAIVEAANMAGQVDELEDGLFRFGRIVSGSPDLRSALSNQFIPAAARRGVVSQLLEGKVAAQALRLIMQAAAHPRGRSLDASLELYANLAAELRERLVAEVRVAIPLTGPQRGRLVAALAAAYGHDVHLNVMLDPQVLGGMSVRIGDELINGSIASRLAELRRDLVA